VILAIVAAIYAVATGFSSLRAQANLITILSFSAPLVCIFFNAYYYFDTTIEMNSPVKTATQIGLLCAMLYFVSETRFLMGVPMPRMFVMLACWVRSLGTLSAVAIPVACIAGKCNRLDYVAGAVLTFCVMTVAGMRTQTLLKSAQES
jgi:hypothetical protein